jgi:predicted HTH transcriptional regulator
MTQMIWVVVGLVAGYLIRHYQEKIRTVVGMHSKSSSHAEGHQKLLEQIMGNFSSDDEITNDKVERLLGVSSSSAERYLNELEKSGKLRQIGSTGQNVAYKKV